MYYGITSSLVKRITSQGTCRRSSSINIMYLSDRQYRFSAVISKKQGNAVERNRVKRVIRELMRLKKGIYPEGLYLIYYKGVCTGFCRQLVESELDNMMKKISKNKINSEP